MAHRSIKKQIVLVIIFLCIVFISTLTKSTKAMQSSSYSIPEDTINFGGSFSTSTSFNLDDTIGEIATGESSSTNYSLYAGFRHMNEVYLSVVPPGNVNMSPAIGGLSGGTSNGNTYFRVITDDPAGYNATLSASNSPAMKSGQDSIANATTVVQYNFLTSANEAYFGVTPEGTELPTAFKDNGASCGVGSSDTVNKCWSGISTTGMMVSNALTGNHPEGSTTTLKFMVNVGNNRVLTGGTYQADLVLTVVPL